jgi:hypothetical protein
VFAASRSYRPMPISALTVASPARRVTYDHAEILLLLTRRGPPRTMGRSSRTSCRARCQLIRGEEVVDRGLRGLRLLFPRRRQRMRLKKKSGVRAKTPGLLADAIVWEAAVVVRPRIALRVEGQTSRSRPRLLDGAVRYQELFTETQRAHNDLLPRRAAQVFGLGLRDPHKSLRHLRRATTTWCRHCRRP